MATFLSRESRKRDSLHCTLGFYIAAENTWFAYIRDAI